MRSEQQSSLVCFIMCVYVLCVLVCVFSGIRLCLYIRLSVCSRYVGVLILVYHTRTRIFMYHQ